MRERVLFPRTVRVNNLPIISQAIVNELRRRLEAVLPLPARTGIGGTVVVHSIQNPLVKMAEITF